MATSGTTSWNLDIAQVIQTAMDLAGGEPTLGEEARSARRLLNLLLTEWQNMGVALWKIDQQTQTVTEAQAEYTTPSDTIDILEMVVRRDDRDTPMTRMSLGEYLTVPNKSQEGRPTRFVVDRQRDDVTYTVYFTPENSTDILVYWRFARIEDVTAQAQEPDVPFRFLPALCFGLAQLVAASRKSVPLDRVEWLRKKATESLTFAMGEDRERAALRIYPRAQVL